MEKSVLIDLEKNRIHALTKDVQAAAQLAKMDNLARCYMCAPTVNAFHKFETRYLRAFYTQMTGQDATLIVSRTILIAGILEVLEQQETRVVDTLITVDLNDPTPMELDKAPRKAPREAAPRKEAGRPKAGSATGRVWEIADGVIAAGTHNLSDKGLRGAVVGAAVAEGINPSTAGVQFLKWKKSQVGA